MTVKRDDSDRLDYPGRGDLTPSVSQVLRAVDEATRANLAAKPGDKSDDQKMSLFWRVFGGTILSIVALVAITLFNNITTSISELRAEVVKANEARAQAVNDLRADIARQADARADLVRKDEFNSRIATAWTDIKGLQAQNNAQNATLTSQKTELDGLKERLGRQLADAEAVKKEQAAAAEAIKKDVAALDVVKERLGALAEAHGRTWEAAQKLREDVNRNQAYDQERKERRDALQKQADEATKELAKGVQECREKLARLEALAAQPAPAPAGPPAPKKQPNVRPAPARPAGE